MKSFQVVFWLSYREIFRSHRNLRARAAQWSPQRPVLENAYVLGAYDKPRSSEPVMNPAPSK